MEAGYIPQEAAREIVKKESYLAKDIKELRLKLAVQGFGVDRVGKPGAHGEVGETAVLDRLVSKFEETVDKKVPVGTVATGFGGGKRFLVTKVAEGYDLKIEDMPQEEALN